MTTSTNKDSIQAINNSICDILKSVEGLDEKLFIGIQLKKKGQ